MKVKGIHPSDPNPYTLLPTIPGDYECLTVLDLKDPFFCIPIKRITQFQRQEGDVIDPPGSRIHDHGWEWSQQHLSHTDSKGEVGQLPRGKSQSLVIRKRGFLGECRKLTHVENANHSVPGLCQAASLCCYRIILSNNSFSPFCR